MTKIRICLFAVALTSMLVGGCASNSTMASVQRSLEEGRLVSGDFIDTYGFLDGYDHLLDPPADQTLGLHLFVDQPFVLTEGGGNTVQVGLSTQRATVAASDIHLLIESPQSGDDAAGAELTRVLNGIAASQSTLPTGTHVSLDWSKGAAPKSSFPSLLEHEDANSLQDFLRRFLRQPFDGNRRHHLVLMVTQHGSWSDSEKQNLLDMATYLKTRKVTLSVVGLGEKPDMGFLARLGLQGEGLFTVLTKEFDFRDWLGREVANIFAYPLQDIQVRLKFASDVTEKRYMSSVKFEYSRPWQQALIPRLKLGEQRVALVEVEIPPGIEGRELNILNASVQYFDPVKNRFFTDQAKLNVSYTDDINRALTQHHPLIQRSKLLIGTAQTLKDVTSDLRRKRVYLGMARLAEQSEKLKAMGGALRDPALLKDAGVLDAYSDKLYEFSDESFQTFKILRDLNWDSDRFKISSN